MTRSATRAEGFVRALAELVEPVIRAAEVPVSEQAIRTWCAAIGEDNALYRDAEAAARAGHGGVFAPLPLLQTWTIPITSEPAGRPPTLHARVRQIAADSGYDAVLATDYELDHLGYVRPDDLLTERSWIESVSDCKQTALGEGHFVTIALEIANQQGTQVGRVRARTLYFRPSSQRSTRQKSPATAPTDPRWPTLDVPITRTLVVAASLAARDNELVHHDHLVARSHGLPDIITGIVTTAGLVNRYAGSQLPPSAVVRRLSLRLASPAVPGDVLHLSGQPESADRLRVVGHHGRGVHVEASLQLGRDQEAIG